MQRKKKCKVCKGFFIPERDMQTICSYPCSLTYARQKAQKNAEGKKKKARKALKQFNDSDVSILKRKAQTIVNQYVRLRDRNLPCISCGTPNAKWDAGHYRASTNSMLRFNTINIRKQCFRCNRMMSANLRPYRENLAKLIGEERVSELDYTNGLKRFDTEYLTRLIAVFRKKIKAMKQRHDII